MTSHTLTTTFFNKKRIEINFRSDQPSHSPFVPDLAQRARGSLKRRAPES